MTVKIMQYKAGRNTCRGKKGIMEYTNQEIDEEYYNYYKKILYKLSYSGH